MGDEEILSLIEELKKYNNEEGYKLSYEEVKIRLSGTIKRLAEKGESALEHLHPLLSREGTWSCLFALITIKEIKSEKSVPHLIDFIKKNEEGDYWDECEEAMLALSSIGKPAIEPLLKEIKSDFENNIYRAYMVGALTEIKDDKVYSFMKEIIENYIENREKYEEWFDLAHFVYNFDKQNKKEILPLLRKLSFMKDLSKHDRLEIQDTILIIEDPEGFEQKVKETAEMLKPLLEKSFSKHKVGRNDPCPCGSGKKYKKCCLKKRGG